MFQKTDLRKSAIEWIENQPKGKFHLSSPVRLSGRALPAGMRYGGKVSTGVPRYQNEARHGIQTGRERRLIRTQVDHKDSQRSL
jgi:hypothetical protein